MFRVKEIWSTTGCTEERRVIGGFHWLGRKKIGQTEIRIKKRNRNCNMWLVRNTERNWVDGGEEGGWRTAGDFLLVGALGGWVGAEKWRW